MVKLYIIPHPTEGFNYYWTCPRGERIVLTGLQELEKQGKVQIVGQPEDADFYILDYVPHNKGVKSRELTEPFEGNRLVVIDWIDEPDQLLADNFCLYFKRSIVEGNASSFSPIKTKRWNDRKIFPFAYCALPEFCFVSDYYTMPSFNERPINFACYLRWTCPNRAKALAMSNDVAQWIPPKRHIGQINEASRSVKNRCHFDQEYYMYLAHTKMNVTCNPTGWEGDSRLWESLSNGCLTFVDNMFVDYPDKLENQRHVVYFDLNNSLDFYNKVEFYLKNQDEAAKIAIAGQEFVKNHHMPVNRMKYVLEKLNV